MALFNTRTADHRDPRKHAAKPYGPGGFVEQGRVRATGTHQQLQKHRDFVGLTSGIN